MKNKWFVVPKPNPSAQIRLICLPYAGGNATTYMAWSQWLPQAVELVAVQLPGRANRMFEATYNKMDLLIKDLYVEMQAYLDKPYILFGHSMGSRIAHELVCKFRTQGRPLPQHFIASGSRAPHIQRKEKATHLLPDAQFIEELRDLAGTPEEVLQNPELIELYMPLLRADFEIAHNFCKVSQDNLDCPISIFSGEEDTDISQADLIAWQAHFVGKNTIIMFPGGHFFIESHSKLVLEQVNKILSGSLTAVVLST